MLPPEAKRKEVMWEAHRGAHLCVASIANGTHFNYLRGKRWRCEVIAHRVEDLQDGTIQQLKLSWPTKVVKKDRI